MQPRMMKIFTPEKLKLGGKDVVNPKLNVQGSPLSQLVTEAKKLTWSNSDVDLTQACPYPLIHSTHPHNGIDSCVENCTNIRLDMDQHAAVSQTIAWCAGINLATCLFALVCCLYLKLFDKFNRSHFKTYGLLWIFPFRRESH